MLLQYVSTYITTTTYIVTYDTYISDPSSRTGGILVLISSQGAVMRMNY